jgi:hypothetical protein
MDEPTDGAYLPLRERLWYGLLGAVIAMATLAAVLGAILAIATSGGWR